MPLKSRSTVPDNCQLVELSERTLLSNIRRRYLHHDIYTFTGSILLAINPYEPLPIYESSTMKHFVGQPITNTLPHVFAIAEEAYRKVRRDRKSQSVVVSGESGAGKTETNKYLMRYLAWRSRGGASGLRGGARDLAEAILQSNPILEAFGNAKTGRNNNSSRFGKFIKISLDQKGLVVGAAIDTYLLEKNRVVHHAGNERSYHALYMLIAGAPPAERGALQLRSASEYAILQQSGVYSNPGWGDDAQQYTIMRDAMGYVGIDEESQAEAMAVVASILHMGNLLFTPKAVGGVDGGGEYAEVRDPQLLELCSALLGIESVGRLVLERTMKVPGMLYNIQLTVAQATSARAALCKALYSLLFDWIVARVNRAILGGATPTMRFIGLLDVFGFETFETNSFEQLCINFANEKLHQFFLQFVFKMEEATYTHECIRGIKIAYADNEPCIRLIEKPPVGLLRILDTQCRTPKASDATYCAAIAQEHSRHECLVVKKPSSAEASHTTAFTVKHFAGAVTYSSDGFLEKNNDSLDQLFTQQLGKSVSGVCREMATMAAARDKSAAQRAAREDSSAGRGAAFASVSRRFTEDINALVATLNGTTAHFIRCMKPNARFASLDWDEPMMTAQLRCNGTLEAVQLMRNGYPNRVPYDLMVDRYRQHLLNVPGIAALSAAQFCEILAEIAELEPADFQLGVSKMFLKAGKGSFLEDLKEQPVEQVSLTTAPAIFPNVYTLPDFSPRLLPHFFKTSFTLLPHFFYTSPTLLPHSSHTPPTLLPHSSHTDTSPTLPIRHTGPFPSSRCSPSSRRRWPSGSARDARCRWSPSGCTCK